MSSQLDQAKLIIDPAIPSLLVPLASADSEDLGVAVSGVDVSSKCADSCAASVVDAASEKGLAGRGTDSKAIELCTERLRIVTAATGSDHHDHAQAIVAIPETAGQLEDTLTGQADISIPANVFMLSGCRDEQTSSDVAWVSHLREGPGNNSPGGVCTAAILGIVQQEDLVWGSLLSELRAKLSELEYKQIPRKFE